MKRSFPFLLLFLLCPWMASAVDVTAYKKDGGTWDDAFRAARKDSRQILLPGGRYELNATLEITDGMTLIFEDGAELISSAAPVIRHTGGTLLLEGRGLPGVLHATTQGQRGWSKEQALRAAAIDMNSPDKNHPPSLVMRNLEIRGFNGVDGYWRPLEDKSFTRNPIASLEITNCRFFCSEKAIAFNGGSLGRARVENCHLEGCDAGIYLDAPMPGGAVLLNNELHDFGRCGIHLGKSGQVADGCTTHLPNAVVRGNRLLKGGRGAKETDSYIHGILVYGSNVTVEGNIVRDVTRGEPVPGEPLGHQIRLEDGTLQRGHWISRNGKKVRLAGSAIYLKANRSIVMGNVCSNSGYRSVIEIKTGGKEPFVSVSNNIVDGRSLDIEESFGFECNSGRSVWSNNVAYDMPHQAFVVRSGFENTFLNNLVVNAKVGFGLSGNVPGQGEWLSGNRFINVQIPVAVDGKEQRPADIPEMSLPGPAYLQQNAELPTPSPEWKGRMLVKGKDIFIGVMDGDAPKWMAFAGKLIEPPKYRTVGPELAFNWNQAGKEISPDKSLNDPAFPGWTAAMRTANETPLDPHDGYISFDSQNCRTGGRAMKILFQKQGAEWSLRQPIALEPGRRYRAMAVLKGEEPRNLRLRVFCGGKNWEQRASDSPEWQELYLDFTAQNSSAFLIVSGSKTSPLKASWLDSVSVKELLQEGQLLPEEKSATGPELMVLPQIHPDGKCSKEWNLVGGPDKVALTTEENNGFRLAAKAPGNLMFSTLLDLQPGEYRFSAYVNTQTPNKMQLSVKFPDGTRASGHAPRQTGQPFRCDFTLPGPGKVNLGIWAGGLVEGDAFLFQTLSLKKLVPKVGALQRSTENVK